MTTQPGFRSVLRKLDSQRWLLPQEYKAGMRVPGLVFASEELLAAEAQEQAVEQVANVAFLPGIVGYSMAMPDIHWGYGFPIGGVAAMRVEDGVVSPGGVGFDINCGVRLVRTGLDVSEVAPMLETLVHTLYRKVPSGVGSEGMVHLSAKDAERVMVQGARWAVERGMGVPEDLEVTEEQGAMPGAEPADVGSKPRQRGAGQIGTLGSGNHFLEVQAVDEVFDHKAARVMGVTGQGQVVVMLHCGSRGFGHQICEDYVREIGPKMASYGIQVPDRQLACAPVRSPEGRRYLSAMKCAANFAWANRQAILHWTREAFEEVFGRGWRELGMHQVYDVSHNMAKIERHEVLRVQQQAGGSASVPLGEGTSEAAAAPPPDQVQGQGARQTAAPGHADLPSAFRGRGTRESGSQGVGATSDHTELLCVHRKGATRAFPPGHPDIPERYRAIGQPVLIPGDMGRYSFLCVGGPESLERSWGSACHGAGRRWGREAAKRALKGRDIRAELASQGIIAMAKGWASLAEEATEAYKDVAEVVEVCDRAGLAKKVARLRPLGVVKG
jgi:tRNA-splicing ligase RtcB